VSVQSAVAVQLAVAVLLIVVLAFRPAAPSATMVAMMQLKTHQLSQQLLKK
jgi:hypothetical protein